MSDIPGQFKERGPQARECERERKRKTGLDDGPVGVRGAA